MRFLSTSVAVFLLLAGVEAFLNRPEWATLFVALAIFNALLVLDDERR